MLTTSTGSAVGDLTGPGFAGARLSLYEMHGVAVRHAGGEVFLVAQAPNGNSLWQRFSGQRPAQIFVCAGCGFTALDEDLRRACTCRTGGAATAPTDPASDPVGDPGELAGSGRIPSRRRREPHCGCCDRVTHHLTCEHCEEPMCEFHTERVRVGADGDATSPTQHLCTICALALLEAGQITLAPGCPGALSTFVALGLLAPSRRPVPAGTATTALAVVGGASPSPPATDVILSGGATV